MDCHGFMVFKASKLKHEDVFQLVLSRVLSAVHFMFVGIDIDELILLRLYSFISASCKMAPLKKLGDNKYRNIFNRFFFYIENYLRKNCQK